LLLLSFVGCIFQFADELRRDTENLLSISATGSVANEFD